jgi:hypothetical protein
LEKLEGSLGSDVCTTPATFFELDELFRETITPATVPATATTSSTRPPMIHHLRRLGPAPDRPAFSP